MYQIGLSVRFNEHISTAAGTQSYVNYSIWQKKTAFRKLVIQTLMSGYTVQRRGLGSALEKKKKSPPLFELHVAKQIVTPLFSFHEWIFW